MNNFHPRRKILPQWEASVKLEIYYLLPSVKLCGVKHTTGALQLMAYKQIKTQALEEGAWDNSCPMCKKCWLIPPSCLWKRVWNRLRVYGWKLEAKSINEILWFVFAPVKGSLSVKFNYKDHHAHRLYPIWTLLCWQNRTAICKQPPKPLGCIEDRFIMQVEGQSEPNPY